MDDRITEIREVIEALRLTPGSGDPSWRLVDPADLEQAILHLGAYADLLDSDALIIRRDENGEWPESVHRIEVVESGPRMGSHGEWEQQEPHIVSSVVEPARCLLPLGEYLIVEASSQGVEPQ